MKRATLKIYSDNELLQGSIIEINGKPFPVRKIKLEGELDSAWVVNAEFLVSELDIEISSADTTISNDELTEEVNK